MYDIVAPDSSQQKKKIEDGGDDGSDVLDRLQRPERCRQPRVMRKKCDIETATLTEPFDQARGLYGLAANDCERRGHNKDSHGLALVQGWACRGEVLL